MAHRLLEAQEEEAPGNSASGGKFLGGKAVARFAPDRVERLQHKVLASAAPAGRIPSDHQQRPVGGGLRTRRGRVPSSRDVSMKRPRLADQLRGEVARQFKIDLHRRGAFGEMAVFGQRLGGVGPAERGGARQRAADGGEGSRGMSLAVAVHGEDGAALGKRGGPFGHTFRAFGFLGVGLCARRVRQDGHAALGTNRRTAFAERANALYGPRLAIRGGEDGDLVAVRVPGGQLVNGHLRHGGLVADDARHVAPFTASRRIEEHRRDSPEPGLARAASDVMALRHATKGPKPCDGLAHCLAVAGSRGDCLHADSARLRKTLHPRKPLAVNVPVRTHSGVEDGGRRCHHSGPGIGTSSARFGISERPLARLTGKRE